MRWVLVLSCSHSLLSDDPVEIGDTDYCPGCGMSFSIVDCYAHRDDDVFARFESDGAPHPDEDSAREHANAHLDDIDDATGQGRR